MKKDSDRGRIHMYWLAAMALILGMVATVRAVDLNRDLLDDAWGTQYGFTSTAISSGDLMGWWQMDDSSFSDVRDRSGNALHGTMTNFPGSPFSAGLFYDGLSFDSDAYADFSGSSLNLSSAFTISLWFKGDVSAYKTTLARWEGANGCLWDLGVTSTGVAQLTFVDSGSNVTTVAGTIGTGAVDVRDDAWHHLAAVYDSTSGVARVYVDGAEEANDTIAGWTFSTAASFVLGNPPGDPANGDFQMDEARLYDVAVGAGDIISLPPTFWDTDGDGLSNLAEQLGGTNPLLTDTDGDGVSDDSDTYPLDYYNNSLPAVSIVSGNFQRGDLNDFLGSALVLEVRDSSSNLLVNAPVSLTVTASAAQISFVNSGTGLASTLSGVTDGSGRITFYAKFPATGPVGAAMEAVATSGVNQAKVSFFATTEDLPASGLQLWLRADLGVVKDGSNYVNRWMDQSGGGRDAIQGASGCRPLWDGDDLSGEATLIFDGSNDYLTPAGLSGASNATVFAVYDKPSVGGAADQRIYCGRYSQMQLIPETDAFISGSGKTDGPQIKVQTYGSNVDFSYFQVGARYDASGTSAPTPYSGRLSELIVFNRVLTAGEQGTVRRYLIQKYNFSIPKIKASTETAVISGATNVTLTADAAFTGATIRYTLDGSEPTEDSSNPSTLTYTGSAISITATATLKVKLFESGFNPSQTAAFVYTLDADTTDVPRSGLKLWLRSDLGVTKDGSDKVSRWADQSGGSNDAVQTGASGQPLWTATGLNGEAALEFDGSNDYLSAPSLSGLSNATVFAVYDKPLVGGAADQKVYGGRYSQMQLIPETDAFISGSGKTDGPQIKVQTYGSNVEFSNFKVGAREDAYGASVPSPYSGKLSELIVFTRVLNAGEQADMRRYLIRKYDFAIPKVRASTETAVISGTTNVTLTADAAFTGATIRYTLDGSEPTEDSSNPSTLTYTGSAISITATTTLKVKLFESGFNASPAAVFVYTLDAGAADVPRSGLKLWFRSDLGVAKDGSDKVSRWADQSGGSNDMVQDEAGCKPLWQSAVLGSQSALFFDGQNDYLMVAKNLGTSPATILVVYEKMLTTGLTQRLFSSTSDQTYADPALGGANLEIKTYGGNVNLSNFHLGARHDAYQTFAPTPFEGKIAEVLVFNRVLGAGEIEAIKLYVYQRFGIFTDKTDTDLDGLPDFEEAVLGTDPENADSNGDGISDGVSVQLGLDPLETDMDGDGISNGDEIEAGTNPFLADSDDDGHNDGADDYALDPTRWEAPAPDPGDTTPPVLTLIKPVDAVLVP